MSEYIISDNSNIIGCFNEKIIAIIFLMDNIINKFSLYLEILKINNSDIVIPKLNSLKITTIITNSSNIKAIDVFDLKNFKLKNIITGENEFITSNSDNIIFNYKINNLKKIISDINIIKSSSDLNIFIPNNALNSEMINNIIINSPKSCDLNCVDKNEKKLDKIPDKIPVVENKKIDIQQFKKDKEEKQEKEKVEEFQRRYSSDKEIYYKLKNEINNSNIPELFKDQYPIMKILDKMNILDEENGFNFYYKKMCDIIKNKTNIYSNMFNDSSYFYANKKLILSSSDSDSEENDSEENDSEENDSEENHSEENYSEENESINIIVNNANI